MSESKNIELSQIELLSQNSSTIYYSYSYDGTLKINYMSSNVSSVLGYKPTSFTSNGKDWLDKIHPDDRAELVSFYKNNSDDPLQKVITRIKHQGGNYRWLRHEVNASTDDNYRIVSAVDITDIKEEALQSQKTEHDSEVSPKEKETLLSEIHHRVKNNLAIMSGLLQMQAFNADEPKLLQRLEENQLRIRAMGQVHEKLYESNTFSSIPIAEYVDGLVKTVSESVKQPDKEITVNKEVEHISLNISQAVPFGIILNELVSNCYRYAFENKKKGEINIRLHQEDESIILEVSDNGQGLPDEFEDMSTSSTAMTLVNTLVPQLNGTFEADSNESGTYFTVTFDIEDIPDLL